LAKTAHDVTNCENLCLAGGVALNCVANGKLLHSGIFKKIWIQPAAGDAGGGVGAALALYHIGLENPRRIQNPDAMKGAYLGPEYSMTDIAKTCKKYHAPYRIFADRQELYTEVAALLAQGNVIGWFQGRMEFGPRALGNRSILGDPRNPEMQKRLNLKIKYREGFRPFAPSVLEEQAATNFELDVSSPYMLLVAPVQESIRNNLPAGYHQLPLWDRLYFSRSTLPAITHVDYSARIQTVSKETNEQYWNLINTFMQNHGCGLVVNTSFNVRGEPIVCTPVDAYICFMRTEMDFLVMGDMLLDKKKQPLLPSDDTWRTQYELD
jgi:carbamoyltransferase